MPNETRAITKSQQGAFEHLTLIGPLTLASLFEFQDAIRSATTPKTIIDLTGVPYMDSAGLGAILRFHASCTRHNHEYAIAGASPRLVTLFQVCKVADFLNLHPTTVEAEASMQ